jgi:molybdopterin/thiamine biosynthesis adenylyltransferase
MSERYARQETLFGAKGQDRIAQSAAAIIGLGGLGSHVAQQLAYLGVVDFILVDPDHVSLSNLNRLIGAVPDDATDGRSKVHVAGRMITAIQPEARIRAVEDKVTSAGAANALEEATVAFSCVDSDAVRLRIIELCTGRQLPWFDLATDTHVDADAVTFGGRVLFSGNGERRPFCMDLLNQDAIRRAGMSRGELEEEARTYGVTAGALQETGPSVVSLNGVVASLATMEFVKWVTGMLTPQSLMTYIGGQGIVRF